MLSPDKRFARDRRIAWHVIENEAVVIDFEDGIDHIHRTFEVDRKRAEKDALRFLKKLIRHELVAEPIA